jgi:hypothetical protein
MIRARYTFCTVASLGRPLSLSLALKLAAGTNCRLRRAAYWARLIVVSSLSLTLSLGLKALAAKTPMTPFLISLPYGVSTPKSGRS